jgi:nucleotide-binding universal stress UspA family protein
MTKKIKRILFALELSSLSESIAPWVRLLGQEFNTEVHVLHVVPELDYYAVAYASSPRHLDDENKILQNAEKKVEAFCSKNLDELPNLKTSVMIGNPAEEIVKYIKNEDISVAVIGTHGKSGLDRALFGSVADRVLRFSPVPVFTVNPHPPKK